jgi:hypothetical protein
MNRNAAMSYDVLLSTGDKGSSREIEDYERRIGGGEAARRNGKEK